MIYKIDASEKVLGRLATEIAVLLRGKVYPKFAPNKKGEDIVEVINVDKITLRGKKVQQKSYAHYSGYPGGLRQITYKELLRRMPAEVLRKAVYGMLPHNRLRAQTMRRLIIKDIA